MRPQNRTFFDAHMIGNAYLPADHGIFFNHGTAGESRLRSDNHIFPNLHVMADMNQIVDLRTTSDASYI